LPFKDPEKAKDYTREYHRKWRRDNRVRFNKSQEKWKKDNPEKVKASQQKYRLDHIEEIRDRQRIYRLKNPEKRRETLRKSGLKRRYKTKIYFIKLLGSKCKKCGYNKCMAALDFHHINPEEKENEYEYRLKDFEQKIKDGKIMLLCANCHREVNWLKIEEKILKELGFNGLLDMGK
jgi:hypothetical protein